MIDFFAEMDASEEAVEKFVEDAKVELVGAAYEAIVNRSPVRTGAYRSEHAVTRGNGDGAALYRSPERSGPNKAIPYHGVVEFNAPSARDAKESVRGTGLSNVTIQNNRFYAGFLEHGTSRMSAQAIYGLSADEVEAFPLDIDELQVG